MQNLNKFLFLGLSATLLGGCNPQKQYNAFIQSRGYIPYLQPLADVGVGVLLSGTANQIRIVAAAKTCFPGNYNGVEMEMRQLVDTELPEIAKKISLTAGLDANTIAANGTPVLKLKSDYHMLKTIDIHIEKASVEYLDELVFADWVNSSMSESCKSYLEKGGSFIRQALKVDKMSFEFKNASGGSINLNAENINAMLDLETNVKWEVTNNYTLTITSPKYIGYQLAKVLPHDPSTIGWVASSMDKNSKFQFKSVSDTKGLK